MLHLQSKYHSEFSRLEERKGYAETKKGIYVESGWKKEEDMAHECLVSQTSPLNILTT